MKIVQLAFWHITLSLRARTHKHIFERQPNIKDFYFSLRFTFPNGTQNSIQLHGQSSVRSQQTAAWPQAWPVACSPQPNSLRITLIWPSHLPLGLPMISFQDVRLKLCMHFSSHPCLSYNPPNLRTFKLCSSLQRLVTSFLLASNILLSLS